MYEISFRKISYIFTWVTGQFLITGQLLIQDKIKLTTVILSLRSFWQKWNFISSDKLLCKHHPKWDHTKGNICPCIYFIKTRVIGFWWMGCFPQTFLHFALPKWKNLVDMTTSYVQCEPPTSVTVVDRYRADVY